MDSENVSSEHLIQSDVHSLPKSERHSSATDVSFEVGGHIGTIVKVIRKPVNTCEAEFYQHLHKLVGEDGLKFFAQFYGLLQARPELPAFIFLEDLTANYVKAAQLDIKIGFKTFMPNAPKDKCEKMGAKDLKTTSGKFGVRLTGYCYFDEKKQMQKVQKPFIHSIKTVEEIEKHLKQFFHDGQHLRTDVISSILPTLEELLDWKKNRCRVAFYSSSLLVVYDATNPHSHGRVKIIDLAHVLELPENERDENFAGGVSFFISSLQNILKTEPAYVSVDSVGHLQCPKCGHHF